MKYQLGQGQVYLNHQLTKSQQNMKPGKQLNLLSAKVKPFPFMSPFDSYDCRGFTSSGVEYVEHTGPAL